MDRAAGLDIDAFRHGRLVGLIGRLFRHRRRWGLLLRTNAQREYRGAKDCPKQTRTEAYHWEPPLTTVTIFPNKN
jgi:hypothetical protein